MSKENKAKVPEVRMTKTARLRLLKANPIIKYQIQKTNNMEMAKSLNLDNVSLIKKSVVDKAAGISSNIDKEMKVRKTLIPNEESKKFSSSKIKKENQEKKKDQVNPIKIQTLNKKVVRRSMSAPRLRPNKDIVKTITEDQEIMNRSVSFDNIPHNLVNEASRNVQTPSDKKKTFNASVSSHKKSLFNLTPSAPQDLRRRLSDWLEKRNKLSSFKHLKCFGVPKIDLIEEENKENVNTSRIQREGSYEDLKIDKPLYTNEDDTTLLFAPSDLDKLAREAMKDLHCLMSEGYPKEQCEAWLKIICVKCPSIVEDPQYWECRATLEQFRGNIGSAVECYKTAVVQGAEVTSVEESLDRLLEKFKLLDIESSSDQKEPQKERVKAMKDFKNVFTSMIIKFAIQEKTIKNTSKNKHNQHEVPNSSSRLLVTPVRRSTRLSRSLYTSTPGTKLCSTIQELNSDEKQKMTFQPNSALLNM
ncbi:uncharacterized protein LOC123673738 isoform X1 [Harmonia axyridis]|uniref:uncharacterized protein LOC123673738 isoform X1 n=1 Tax=Harmonia axyridis TaxID=115357 RepID=UPI001E2780CE|nr:uncharacterized protein LOC123673738 isoform X1 [Harmonia axyridis]